jgi:SNW domain-containing protein 1
MQESIKMMDNIKKEKELSLAAKEAREKKIAMAVSNISSVMTNKTDDTDILIGKKTTRYKTEEIPIISSYDQKLEDEKLERNKLRNIRKKEIERDRRIEVAGTKKAKLTRDVDRDISEKIALGQAQPSKESMVDARLYNQVTGLESGFKEEEDYDLYDKPLFVDRTQASIFKNVRAGSSIDDDKGNDVIESKKLMEKIYKRGNMFEGADITMNKGGKPIEFERTQEEYGLNDIHKRKIKKD